MIILLLLIGLLYYGAYRIYNRPRYKPKAAINTRNESSLAQLQAENRIRQQERREREQAAKEAERRRKEAEKAAAQAKKERQRKEQAIADEQFYKSQMDAYNEMLVTLDESIKSVREQIRINDAMQSYDKSKKERATLEKLLKKQLTTESKIHTFEKQLAKCYYIINSADKKQNKNTEEKKMKVINKIKNETVAEIVTNHAMSIDDVIKMLDWRLDADGEIFDSVGDPVNAFYDDLEMVLVY